MHWVVLGHLTPNIVTIFTNDTVSQKGNGAISFGNHGPHAIRGILCMIGDITHNFY